MYYKTRQIVVFIKQMILSYMDKPQVAASGLISLAAAKYGLFDVRFALAAAKMLNVVKLRNLLLRSRPSAHCKNCGCCQMVWPLLAGLIHAWILYTIKHHRKFSRTSTENASA